MRHLPYGAVSEVARFCHVGRPYVSGIVHGHHDWRKADPFIVRQLYAVGWSPAEGRRTVRTYLNKRAASLMVPLDTDAK